MKIAILVPLFPPRWIAGTEIATYNIATYLAKRGHEVHVITSFDEGLPKESSEQGFYVHRIGWRKVRFLGIISFWLKMTLIVRNIKPETIHCQDLGMGIPGYLASKLLKRPYSVWGQGSDVYLPSFLSRLLSKFVLRNADVAIALTEDMKKKMQNICDREILVIPNGIDLKNFQDLPPKHSIRKSLGIGINDEVILFVGRFRPEKGLKYLIYAMQIIKQKNVSARLMLVGEGPEENNLRQLVHQLNLNSVTFVGQIANEKVPQFMMAADIFMLPSLSEGLPNVVLEAMASGLPIVASKVGGLPEIIIEGINGFLVEPKNAEQIAEKVILLQSNDELRENISKNNKEKVRGYSLNTVIENLEGAYQKLYN
jgi:glycosyltransferase involved in cell wall biosynthesis